ncbi:MAG TPA: caspase family protein, partial [Armatimonadota bacterium]|nr:caspase family protein [Armatimonadota bacterium]
KVVRLWDTTTGAPKQRLSGHKGVIRSITFSPDGALLASGDDDETIRLWSTRTGTLARKLTSSKAVWMSLAFSPDGKRLAAANNWTDNLQVWDPRTGIEDRSLTGHSAGVEAVAFSPDGRRLASGGRDNTVRLWDGPSGKPIATLVALPPTPRDGGKPISIGAKSLASDEYLVVTPAGYYAGSPASDRFVRFRLGTDSFPAECFRPHFFDADLVAQALAGKALPPLPNLKGPYPPQVTITSRGDGAHPRGDTLDVTLVATDDTGVTEVALFVDGARVATKPTVVADKLLVAGAKPILPGDKRVPEAHTASRTFTARVPLPAGGGANNIEAIVFDRDGLQSPRDEILLSRDPTARPAGKLLGLCVGVSEYADSGVRDLKYADADARALGSALKEQRGIYTSADVQSLVNEQATRTNVRSALEGLVKRATKADTVVVFLSGHGWRSVDRGFYFATHELEPRRIEDTALPWSDVLNQLTRLSEQSRRVVLLLDACYSGSAASNEELVNAVVSAKVGVVVFASSTRSEVSIESPELMHGVFTKALLEGISGAATPSDEKQVSILDFLAYVVRRVKELTNDRQHPYIPFFQELDPGDALVTTR